MPTSAHRKHQRTLNATFTLLGLAGVAACFFFDGPAAAIASMALLVGARGVARRRTWGAFVLLGAAAGIAYGVSTAMLPWWLLIPMAGASLAFIAVLPVLLRVDAFATVLLAITAIAIGGGASEATRVALTSGLVADVISMTGVDQGAAYRAGQRQARRDVARGILTIRTYGLPSAARGTYAQMLRNNHGIRLTAVAGCVVTTALTERTRGYNDVSHAAISRRFGPNFLGGVWQRARARYASTLPPTR